MTITKNENVFQDDTRKIAAAGLVANFLAVDEDNLVVQTSAEYSDKSFDVCHLKYQNITRLGWSGHILTKKMLS